MQPRDHREDRKACCEASCGVTLASGPRLTAARRSSTLQRGLDAASTCTLRIERTPCNLGGSRHWFICPVVGCGRRVAILYGGGIFACRQCHRFAYASSRDPRRGLAELTARFEQGTEMLERTEV
jgi:hypothetical protein